MAEAVVGATVEVLVKNLIAFSVEEIGRIWNFRRDLKSLKDSVATIRYFLEDAETKQVTDKAVQRWLMELEAVAFDADYVFDQLNYQVLRKKVQRGSKMKKKVRCFFPNCKSFSFRHKMAREIKNIRDKLKSINQEATELGLQARMVSAPAPGAGTEAPTYRETNSLSMDPVFVGRENDATKIVEMVNNSPTEKAVSVIPIVGMGGLGKTTLARKVFNDDTIISGFQSRIWVYVSENFVPKTVFKNAFESLTGEKTDGSDEFVLRKLREKIGEKRYLLVLDDVWSEDKEKWDLFITSLEAISPVKGNVVILTTRKGNVASTVKTIDRTPELGVLSGEDCWGIIKAKAFEGDNIPSEFEFVGKKIAERCGGLPLAAKVVGSLLRGKKVDEWSSIENKWISDIGGDDNNVSKILKLSVDNLSSPSLKKCFAYCSILPKGWLTEREELIHLWMAEGFLQTDQETDMEIEGDKVFNILLQSSLLQVQGDYYGMHDLVHDLASSILNSKFLDGARRVRYTSITLIDESSPIPEECLRGLFYGGKISPTMFSNLKRLHVLILDDDEMEELPIEIGKLISLRLLDISNTKIECLPDSIGDLYHLQTLRATEEYGGESCLRKLPNTFKFLTSLRHLYISNIELPPEIGKLSSLQTLPYFRVGDEEGCGIMELGSLKNLKGEMEIHNLEKVRDKEEAKSADLIHKPDLKLKLVWNESREDGGSNDENVLEGLLPHRNLKSLKIKGFRGTSFPSWTLRMDDFDNLLEIKLSKCRNCEEVPMLGHLPRLKSLYLSHLSNVKSMGSSFYGIKEDDGNKEKIMVFPSLERLELIGMESLTAWNEVELSSSSRTQPREVLIFHRLEFLKIKNCRQLKSAPSHFPCLKELEIDNMESGVPLASICGSKLTALKKLKLHDVGGVVCLLDLLFNNNQDLLELDIRECTNLSLFHKPNMLKLKLRWNESREDDQSNDEEVLEGLLPHRNLKSLEIEGFRGTSFPSWTLRMDDFDNLLEIKLSKCRNCEEVPMLGHLPRLKSLSLCHLSNVKSMGSSFYGIKEDDGNKEKIMVFPSLEKLELIGMESLTAWSEVELSSSSRTQPREVLVFCLLECLKINDCRQLKSAPSHFPCLKELEIDNMESGVPLASICGSKLTALTKLKIRKVDGAVSLPDELFNNNRGLLELDIQECSNFTHLVPCLGGGGVSLRKLVIWYCQNLVELPEDVHKLNALEEWRIWGCPNLKSIAYPSGTQLSSQGFISLRHLEFCKCSEMTNLPCEMLESCALSLEELELSGSKSITNLPQVMSIVHKMSHLTELGITDIPLRDVVVEIGSLGTIKKLSIGGRSSDCGDNVLFDSILPAFQSLGALELYGMEEWDGLPEQLLHLTTLHLLSLFGFGIQVLPEWLERLASLRYLVLGNCKKLRHLASKKAMQALTKLNCLNIFMCPLLEQELKQGRDRDDSEWSKVSHVPHILGAWSPTFS